MANDDYKGLFKKYQLLYQKVAKERSDALELVGEQGAELEAAQVELSEKIRENGRLEESNAQWQVSHSSVLEELYELKKIRDELVHDNGHLEQINERLSEDVQAYRNSIVELDLQVDEKRRIIVDQANEVRMLREDLERLRNQGGYSNVHDMSHPAAEANFNLSVCSTAESALLRERIAFLEIALNDLKEKKLKLEETVDSQSIKLDTALTANKYLYGRLEELKKVKEQDREEYTVLYDGYLQQAETIERYQGQVAELTESNRLLEAYKEELKEHARVDYREIIRLRKEGQNLEKCYQEMKASHALRCSEATALAAECEQLRAVIHGAAIQADHLRTSLDPEDTE